MVQFDNMLVPREGRNKYHRPIPQSHFSHFLSLKFAKTHYNSDILVPGT